MDANYLPAKVQEIHGADTNSLLRFFDRAQQLSRTSTSQLERSRAGRAARRIGKELQRRNVGV